MFTFIFGRKWIYEIEQNKLKKMQQYSWTSVSFSSESDEEVTNNYNSKKMERSGSEEEQMTIVNEEMERLCRFTPNDKCHSVTKGTIGNSRSLQKRKLEEDIEDTGMVSDESACTISPPSKKIKINQGKF
ncbi:hypothetical protein RFI_28160, partial [Reticulomyxa filosa]